MSNSNRKPKKTKGLGAGIIAFGVVFAIFSAIFHPHSLRGYILAFVLSGLFGAIVKVMGEGLDLTVKEKAPDSLKNMAENTGNPDVDELLQRGRDMITELHTETKAIGEAPLAQKLTRLEKQCAEILRAVYNEPTKAPQIRKFMEYYLPTTLKMTKGYRLLKERNVAGEEALAARKRIDEAIGVVLNASQRMLDNLYRNDVLDLTTDIAVLEQMLKRDGLTESDLSMAAAQARRAAEIDRAVDATALRRQGQPEQGAQAAQGAVHTQAPSSQATAQMPQKMEE